MEKNIAKSPEMLAKEAKIKDLQKALKKRKSVLKSLKTRLKNTKSDIEDIQRNIQNIMFSRISKMDELRIEIGELALKMKQNKHFSKADKKALDEMSREFLDGNIFGDEFEEIREAKRKAEEGDFDFDENFRAKMNDAFAQFRVAPEEKEQKNIRKVFIKLSRKFHPDLAENEQQAAEFHGMMQQINEAYKANDVHTLLEMEQLYLMEELDFSTASITIDVLQNEIDRLERDVEFINGQVDRTSLEIKQLRKSDMGSMLTGIKKADREGEGIKAMEAEFDEMIGQLEQIKAGFADSLERGSISPILIQMMNPFAGVFGGNMPSDMPDLSDMPEGMEDIFGDLFSMMMEEEGDDYEENENPKFPIGTFVKVNRTITSSIDDETSMKGWQGWVDYAFIDEGKPVYTINFDIPTMKKMPKSLLKEAIEEGIDFQQTDFYEYQIKTTKENGNIDDAIAFAENLRIDVQWENTVDGKELILIKKILKANPNQTDEDNWTTYLKSIVPFEAKGMGKFELKKGKKVIVKDVNHCNINVGFTVIIQEEKSKKRPYEYPLDDLMPIDKTLLPIFELHSIWFYSFYTGRDDSFF
ncbi:MAG: hypothetical protein AB8G11_26455 [Saprospiraceae bacterium]